MSHETVSYLAAFFYCQPSEKEIQQTEKRKPDADALHDNEGIPLFFC